MKRTNRQEEMFSLIELQQQSGQTILSFCKEHRITLSNFNYWGKWLENSAVCKYSLAF